MQEKIEGFVEEFFAPTGARLDWACPSGIPSLDVALGGALPCGAVEVYGDAGVGKTAVGYEILASAQLAGQAAALVSSEYLDLPYARAIGVDLENLAIITGSLEGALESVQSFVAAGPSVVVVDTATSLRPEDDRLPGNWLFTWAEGLRRVLRELRPSSCVVLINQVRRSRSLDHRRGFLGFVRDPGSTSRKLVDVFSTRLELSRSEANEKGYELQFNILGHAYTMPGRAVFVPATRGSGVDTCRDLVRCAVRWGVVAVKGTWYYYGVERMGQGENAATKYLEEHTDVAEDIVARVLSRATLR